MRIISAQHKTLWRLFAILLLPVLLVISAPAFAKSFADEFKPTNPPKPLPAFLFQDADGKSLDLKDFRGQLVLLNVWATWCGPCIEEMPSLDALQGHLRGQKFSVIALTTNRDGLAAAKGFYSRHGIKNLNVYADSSGRALSLLRVRGLPISFLIDPNGMEIGRFDGSVEWNTPEALAFFQARLPKKP